VVTKRRDALGGTTSGPDTFDRSHNQEQRSTLVANVGALHFSDTELVYMFAGTRNQPEAEVLPLGNAVFCLDCEIISNSRRDECPACKSRSLVSLARMLGGSLLLHEARRSQECEDVLFDITITVELQRMHAKDLNTTLESLTNLIGPRLARGRASFHINVEPTVVKLLLSQSSIETSDHN
jgi:hypothetical protein